MDDMNRLMASDLPNLEKLAQAYRLTTSDYIEAGRRQVELFQALGDREQVVKEEIMLGVMERAWEMFEYCFLKVTGRRVLNDEPKS